MILKHVPPRKSQGDQPLYNRGSLLCFQQLLYTLQPVPSIFFRMVVKLRLSPHRLLPNSPQKVYRLVAINSPKSRDSAPLETLGVYDAVPRHVPSVPRSERSLLDEGKEVQKEWVKRTEWDAERIKYWLGTGAQPSRRVAWLLHKVRVSAQS